MGDRLVYEATNKTKKVYTLKSFWIVDIQCVEWTFVFIMQSYELRY